MKVDRYDWDEVYAQHILGAPAIEDAGLTCVCPETSSAADLVPNPESLHRDTQYAAGRGDVARAVLRTLDSLTTPTDEETTRG